MKAVPLVIDVVTSLNTISQVYIIDLSETVTFKVIKSRAVMVMMTVSLLSKITEKNLGAGNMLFDVIIVVWL